MVDQMWPLGHTHKSLPYMFGKNKTHEIEGTI